MDRQQSKLIEANHLDFSMSDVATSQYAAYQKASRLQRIRSLSVV
jgi:hypothetical protein